MRFFISVSPLIVGLLYSPATQADIFGSGSNSFEIVFVPIGNPGNPPMPKPNSAGSVPYRYRIGKFEVSEQMIHKANTVGGLGITHGNRGANKPATEISWYEAARFVNWLNTSTGNLPAYKFDADGLFQFWQPDDLGYNPANAYRNKLAKYFLPSYDEWHKAAYYDPATSAYYTFPTGSHSPPIPVANGTDPGTAVYDQLFSTGPADITDAGGLSPYGTMAQAGNVAEWQEQLERIFHPSGALGLLRGGTYLDDYAFEHFKMASVVVIRTSPSSESIGSGFRVVSIPEPSSLLLAIIVAILSVLILQRRLSCNTNWKRSGSRS